MEEKEMEEELRKIGSRKKPRTIEELEEQGLLKEENGDIVVNIPREETRQELLIPQLGKPVSVFAGEVGDYFSKKNMIFYRPIENTIVKVKMIPYNKEKDKKIMGFQELKEKEFVTLLEKYFDVGIMVYERNQEPYFKHKTLSKTISEITLASSQLRDKLPLIEKIFNVPLPMLKDEKLVFPKKGYDEELWSWLPLDSPEIDENMTVEDGKKVIDQIFSEFCFKGEQDKINARAGLLTPFCRQLYKTETARTPIFFYKANRERAGKDYCAGITGITYEGVAIDESPISSGRNTNDEEFRKKILSIMKLGKCRLHSSNNKGFLNSAVLEMISTSENFCDRQLGSNTLLTFPNTLEFSLSANTGITYTPDLANRCLFINLFLGMEDPNKREFITPDLHERIKDNRSQVLSALYSLVKNWFDKGMPKGTQPFASYHEWARVVGGIMESAGYSTPCVVNDECSGIGGDRETQDMKKLFEMCNEKWEGEWITKNQIMNEIENPDSDFNELFSWFDWDNANRSSRTKFGLLMKKFTGREFSGIRLVNVGGDERESRQKYKFELVGNVGNVGNVLTPQYNS